MSTLSRSDVEKIADLSKLALANDKLAALTHSLDNILSLVKKMDSINTQSVEPLAHPFEATQPLRTDNITETNQRELFQKNAPRVESGLYIVPKFVEE